MKKLLCTILATAFAAALSASAKTFDWPIDATTAGARQFTAYHGETVRFNLQFKGAMTNLAPVCIYYQTNGMGKAEWFEPIPGTVFHPTNDCGAAFYRFFVRCTDPDGVNYSANGSLRMLDSPGFEPSTVRLPVQTLDFSTIDVLNPPWPTDTPDYSTGNTQLVATIQSTAPAPGNYAAVSNAAMTAAQNSSNNVNNATNALVHALGQNASEDERIKVGEAHEADYAWEANQAVGAHEATWAWGLGVQDAQETRRTASTIFAQLDAATATNAQQSSILADIAASVGTNSANVATLGTQVAAIGAHLGAEDAHFVSTNYDSAVRLPEAYVEIKMHDQQTGSNTWITIWQEMRRWTAFVGSAFDWQTWQGFHAWATNITHELSFKADRCWGIYDSETGGYSPEGFTQISSSNILIAAGMAYQRTITSDGAVWVLQCNQGVAHIGGDTNGFFRVIDSDGNTQFEIVKGDRREVGANASGITVNNGTSPPTVTIPYSIEAGEHPTLQICDDLITADWKSDDDPDCLATVEWTGTSGAYVATVQRKAAGDALFVRATYMAGGETYIKNVAPISVGGGILCTDGIHKVRPVYNNGTITWQVVQ